MVWRVPQHILVSMVQDRCMLLQAQELQRVEEEALSRIPKRRTDWTGRTPEGRRLLTASRYGMRKSRNNWQYGENVRVAIMKYPRHEVQSEGTQHGNAMSAW